MDQNQNQNQNKSLTLEDIQLKIADALGVTGSTDEKDLNLVDKASDVILKKIFLESIERMSEPDAEEYAKLLEAGSPPEVVRKFLDEKIPDYSGMLDKLLNDFISEMKQAAANPLQ